LRTPEVKVPGNEFAGEVEAVGAGVTAFEIGDRVFGYNEGPFGGHAEYMTIAQDSWVATMPAGSTFEQAAPSLEGSHYALAFLRTAKVAVGRRFSSTAPPEPSARRRCYLPRRSAPR
jgi:NADPH:quinone reductase-like Zn-dependent oxidoreductase